MPLQQPITPSPVGTAWPRRCVAPRCSLSSRCLPRTMTPPLTSEPAARRACPPHSASRWTTARRSPRSAWLQRSAARCCMWDVVCWTSVALIVACCKLHVTWWSGPPLIADAVHSHAQWAARSRALERARAHIVPEGDRKVCAWHRNARVGCRSGRTTRRASHRGRMRTSCDSPATWYVPTAASPAVLRP